MKHYLLTYRLETINKQELLFVVLRGNGSICICVQASDHYKIKKQ